ncbi:MAG: glycosyltransferase [Firmicutes bacterium]|nr:glycosyltransferase [Bacillota bacterium]
MQIDQIIPEMRYGYEISDIVLTMRKILKDIGFNSDILTEAVQGGKRENIFYHMFTGSKASKTLAGLKAKRKFLFYHGIAPPEYFNNHEVQADLIRGRKDLKTLKNQFTFALTTTNYLEKELHEAGYTRTVVLPLPLDLNEYDRQPYKRLLNKYENGYTNILFVGQITPDKKLENTISIFNYYHKKYNPKSCLFLVGSFAAHPRYCQKLFALIKELDIKNVFLTGRVSFRQLLSYYRLSQVFLHMSEYEGFSIPLVEAMYLKVPIIALNRAAVPEVLGGAGCLINDADFQENARQLDRIVNDRAMREVIIRRQSERVTDFMPAKVLPSCRIALQEIYRFVD